MTKTTILLFTLGMLTFFSCSKEKSLQPVSSETIITTKTLDIKVRELTRHIWTTNPFATKEEIENIASEIFNSGELALSLRSLDEDYRPSIEIQEALEKAMTIFPFTFTSTERYSEALEAEIFATKNININEADTQFIHLTTIVISEIIFQKHLGSSKINTPSLRMDAPPLGEKEVEALRRTWEMIIDSDCIRGIVGAAVGGAAGGIWGAIGGAIGGAISAC